MTLASDVSEKTWQQTKSERTRTAILDAAMSCFYKRGYFNTTTENIAQEAGVSRGAMLHHFPTRSDLIKAAVEHLTRLRLEMFTREESQINEGAEHTRIEEGIDAYWRQLNTKAFTVSHELQVAARTDKVLAKELKPALRAYYQALARATEQIFPDLAQSEAYARTTYMTQYLLEGMAVSRLVVGPSDQEDMILDWLKKELRRSYSDVRQVKRRK